MISAAHVGEQYFPDDEVFMTFGGVQVVVSPSVAAGV